jgi:hypothetical protein
VATGYRQNVVGFGWTNGVYLEMQALLRRAGVTIHPAASAPCAQRGQQEAQR